MIIEHPLTGETLYVGLFEGRVVDNRDPLGLGRVRIAIEGITEATDWARPLGTIAGGSATRGGLAVPSVDAEVGVLFNQGNLDAPRYIGGGYGDGIDPERGHELGPLVEAAGEEACNIATFRFGAFAFVLDAREDKLSFRVETAGGNLGLELDLKRKGIIIDASTAIILRSRGLIHLDALTVRLKNRLLRTTSEPV